MPTLDNPPEYIRNYLREALINDNGICTLSIGPIEELKRLRFYLETFERFISEQQSEEIRSLEPEAMSLPAEHRDDFWAWYYPVHWDDIFRTNLRSSFLISLMSFLEMQMNQVCRNVAMIARTPIASGDLKGSLIERAKMFLISFAAFKRPTAEQWGNVTRIYDVRNVFVHHGGYLRSYNHDRRVREFAKHQAGLNESNGFITLGDEFCNFALLSTETFLEAIFQELAALCGRVRAFEAA